MQHSDEFGSRLWDGYLRRTIRLFVPTMWYECRPIDTITNKIDVLDKPNIWEYAYETKNNRTDIDLSDCWINLTRKHQHSGNWIRTNILHYITCSSFSSGVKRFGQNECANWGKQIWCVPSSVVSTNRHNSFMLINNSGNINVGQMLHIGNGEIHDWVFEATSRQTHKHTRNHNEADVNNACSK